MRDEIESLNLNDLDIEELERRIELGQMIPIFDDPQDDCTIKSGCDLNCGTNTKQPNAPPPP